MQKRTKKKWQRWYETILGPLKQISLFGIKEMEVKQKRRITLLQNLSPPRFGIFSLITVILLVFYLFCPFCLIACTPVHWSRPGFPVLHHLLEFVGFMSIQWWCYLTISSSASPFSFCLQSFPALGFFPMSQLFASGGLSIGASASASPLPMNLQGNFFLKDIDLCLRMYREWFPLYILKTC